MKGWRLFSALTIIPVTLVAIGLELWFGLDSNPDTLPWTYWISRYIPWPVQLLAYLILATWLPFHFWQHDRAKKKAHAAGFAAGLEHADYQHDLSAQQQPAPAPARRPGTCPTCQQDLM